MKQNLLIVVFSFFMFPIFSQECKVMLKDIQETYNGDCKKNLANGEGLAKGRDMYKGEFKNGYPDGKGKYNWENGDWYDGEWKNGKQNGKGEMHIKRADNIDSIITGFWKTGAYKGQYEKPYEVSNASFDIAKVTVSAKKKSTENEILVVAKNVGVTPLSANSSVNKKPTINSIVALSGRFEYQNTTTSGSSESGIMLGGVEFPIKIKIYTGSDSVEVAIYEAGSWKVEIEKVGN